MIEYEYWGTGRHDYEEVLPNGRSGFKLTLFIIGLIIWGIIDAVGGGWPFGAKVFLLLIFLSLCGILMYNNCDDYEAKIILYKRYFMVNNNYIYYLGISEIEKDDVKGCLIIKYFIGDKKEEVIVRKEKFPTGARKDFKIEANRRAKFNKVSEKIISCARAANPDVEVIVKEVKKEVEQKLIGRHGLRK